MKKILFLCAFVLLTLLSGTTFAEMIKCTECGMPSEITNKFTSRVIQNGEDLFFCDIGDLFAYLNKQKLQSARVQVKDFFTGQWIDAHQAFYVHSKEKYDSPMGWGVAAFKDRKHAVGQGTAMDFKTTMKALQ